MKKMQTNPELKKLSVRIQNTAKKLETMMEKFEKLSAKEKTNKNKKAKPTKKEKAVKAPKKKMK